MNYDFDDVDELFLEAVTLCCEADKASASFLQRKLDIGYTRAARLLDQLEQLKVISTTEKNEPRRVLISDPKEFSFDQAMIKRQKENALRYKLESKWKKENQTSGTSNKSKNISVQIGLDKKKLVTLPITDIGNVYVYPSSLANHLGFIKTTIDKLVGTYDQEAVKLIIADETRSLTYLNGCPNLLTPVLTDELKIGNALGWSISEMERRIKNPTFSVPKIFIFLNFPSGMLGMFDEEIYFNVDRLLTLGYSLGIHLYIVSGLNDKKLSKILASIPTKIIFKTHSLIDADQLGIDDAFDLKDKDEFIFIPPYGDIQKLRVGKK